MVTEPEYLEILLEGDVDINSLDKNGKTALDHQLAMNRYSSYEVIELLQEHGAKTSQELRNIDELVVSDIDIDTQSIAANKESERVIF